MTNTSVFIFLTVFLLFLAVGLVIYIQRLQARFAAQKEQLNLKAQEAWKDSEQKTQASKLMEQELSFSGQELQEKKQALDVLTADHEQLAVNFQKVMTDYKVLQASVDEERKSQQEKVKMLEDSKQTLKLEFENLANQLLEKKSESLKGKQEEFFEQTLSPLRAQLKEFRERVDKVYDEENRQRQSLKTELQQLKDLNQKISDDAVNLTNALKGSQKTQGNWGELILERVLESSGLRKGHEYLVQTSFKSEEGKTYLPDVIVNLPDDKQLIIDSKVSLLDYQRYCEEDDLALKNQYLTNHINSIKTHVKSLSEKRYEDLVGVNSLDFVFMFLPIEAAFLLALEKQPELFQAAYDKQVILVSPTTLLATLRTVENMWRFQHQNQNAEKIAQQAGALYDQCVLVAESLDDVGKAINKTQQAFDTTKKRLTDGRGNVVRRIEQIKKLGAKTKKQIPESMKSQVDNDLSEDDVLLEQSPLENDSSDSDE